MAWTIRQMDDFGGWPYGDDSARVVFHASIRCSVWAVQGRMRAVSMFTSRRLSARPRSVRGPWQIGHTAGAISAAPQEVAVAAQLQGWMLAWGIGEHVRSFPNVSALTGGDCGEGRATVSLGRAPTAPRLAALVHQRKPCRSRASAGDPRPFSRRKESNEVGHE